MHQKGEKYFFAEVPGKGIDRKVEAVLLKDNSGCKNCVFFQGELKDLCMQINCLNRGEQLTFRKVKRMKSNIMKKLDLSMLPIDLKVGEEMEVLTPKGDKVTVRCVEDKRNDMCENCFFGENSLHICSYVKCSERERETKDSVSFQEVKRERMRSNEKGRIFARRKSDYQRVSKMLQFVLVLQCALGHMCTNGLHR